MLRSVIYRLLNTLISILSSSRKSNAITSGLIFSRFTLNHPSFYLIGSGRMQIELTKCIQAFGYQVIFCGQEDRIYPLSLYSSDFVISTTPGLLKLPSQYKGHKLLFTCNTHVNVRNLTLRCSAKKWNLPIEDLNNEEHYIASYNKADYLLIAENEHGIGNFVNNGIPENKIRTYNNCVDVNIWQPVTVKQEKFTFMFWSSSIGLRKGLASLLKAWDIWFQGQNAQLIIIGNITSTGKKIIERLPSNLKEKNLLTSFKTYPAQFTPAIKLIGSCHIGILPTLEDAMPSSLLEMASCGLPLLTTIESGINFPDRFCFYHQKDNEHSIVDGFEYWYSQRDSIHELQKQVRQYTVENHSWEYFQNRFSLILSEILQKNPIKQISF
jgi:glycosyltransferase involved in cell wall biosynthesis